MANSESYYRFQTATSTSVLFAVDEASPAHTGSGDWTLTLYSDAAMSTVVVTDAPNPNDHISPYYTGLAANTVYYVKLANGTSSATTYQITVKDPPTIKSLGSTGSPILLMFGGTSSATSNLVVTSNLADTSYYAFTAPVTGTATISYPEAVLDATLYTTNTYTGSPAAEETLNSVKTLAAEVTADQEYYLKIKHWGSGTSRIMGTLSVSIE